MRACGQKLVKFCTLTHIHTHTHTTAAKLVVRIVNVNYNYLINNIYRVQQMYDITVVAIVYDKGVNFHNKLSE